MFVVNDTAINVQYNSHKIFTKSLQNCEALQNYEPRIAQCALHNSALIVHTIVHNSPHDRAK